MNKDCEREERRNNNVLLNSPGDCHFGIRDVLAKIVRMQNEADEIADEGTCERDFLSFGICERVVCNTRPVLFYTHEDRCWQFPISKTEEECHNGNESTVFRVEKVEGCTATCRVLKQKEPRFEDNDVINNRRKEEKFEATESFFIIDIEDIAAIRCLPDTFVQV